MLSTTGEGPHPDSGNCFKRTSTPQHGRSTRSLKVAVALYLTCRQSLCVFSSLRAALNL